MKYCRFWPVMYLPPLAVCCCSLAFGSSIADLAAANHVRIDSALAPNEGIVPGQRVTLTLAVATDTWFTGGTRVGIPEVPGLVIVQTEQFASNASETRDGKPWEVQRWTLDVFPQRAGEFTLGPIPVKVQVTAGDSGDTAGELRSPPRQFSVAVPESLARIKHWVAAPSFTVSQRFDRSLDKLEVGDAFEQEIRFEATDVLAMMLPEYAASQLAGLAAYPSPPVLDNSANRGQILASRSVRISYVVEQPGQFLLPARDYYWWNTQSAELTLLSVPETRIAVGGEISSQATTRAAVSLSPRHWLALALSLVLLVAAVLIARRYLPRLTLAQCGAQLSIQAHRLQRLFKPVLATRLNPGSNGGE